MHRTLLVVFAGSTLFLAAAPSNTIPHCEEGALLVSTGDGWTCRSFEALLKSKRTNGSWGNELLLPDCASGSLLQAESFAKWKCVEPASLIPRCSSGETLRSQGSSGWSCERLPALPSCSSGETLVSSGGHDWSCARLPH